MSKRVIRAVLWIIATLVLAALAAVLCGTAAAMAGLLSNSCDVLCDPLWQIGGVLGFLAALIGSASLWNRRGHPSPAVTAIEEASGAEPKEEDAI